MTPQLNTVGVDDEPTKDDLVAVVVKDDAFVAACGPLDREARAKVADAALTAALIWLGLFALLTEIEHESAGHG